MITRPTFKPGKCFYCFCAFVPRLPIVTNADAGRWLPRNETLEHVYPNNVPIPNGFRRGHPFNRLRVCHACNNRKSNVHPLIWLQCLQSDTAVSKFCAVLRALGENETAIQNALRVRRSINRTLTRALT